MPEKFTFIRGLMLLIFLGFLLCPAYAQEDITHVGDSAFENPMRPPVRFHHDAHNERAGIIECSACHHSYKDGEKQENADSIGIECSECHFSKDRNNTIVLIRAYHGQCAGCHAEKKSGPIMCGDCHKKK